MAGRTVPGHCPTLRFLDTAVRRPTAPRALYAHATHQDDGPCTQRPAPLTAHPSRTDGGDPVPDANTNPRENEACAKSSRGPLSAPFDSEPRQHRHGSSFGTALFDLGRRSAD